MFLITNQRVTFLQNFCRVQSKKIEGIDVYDINTDFNPFRLEIQNEAV